MIARILALFRHAEPDPFGIESSLAFRKQLRLKGYQRPERRRG